MSYRIMLAMISIVLPVTLVVTGCDNLGYALIGGKDKAIDNLASSRGADIYGRIDSKISDWPRNTEYPINTLGSILGPVFQGHALSCGLTTAGLSSGSFVSRHILDLVDYDLAEPVQHARRLAGRSILFYLFTDDVTDLNEIDFATSTYRIINATELGLPAEYLLDPRTEISGKTLRENCALYVRGALTGGLNPGFMKLRAALDADYNRSSEIVAVRGTFVSPMAYFLSRNDDRGLQAKLALWSVLYDNPQFIGRAKYVREFHGLMARRVVGAEQNRRLDSEVSLGVSSIDVQIDGGFSVSSQYGGTDWVTVVLNPEIPEHLMSDIPSASRIAEDFARYGRSVSLETDRRLARNTRHTHWINVRGVPESLCEGAWDLSIAPDIYTDANPDYQVLWIPGNQESAPTCRLSITGTPRDSYFPQRGIGPNTVALSYEWRNSKELRHEEEDFVLALAIDGKTLNTTNHPVIQSTPRNVIPMQVTHVSETSARVSWELHVNVDHSQNRIDLDVLPTVEASVNCEGRAIPVVGRARLAGREPLSYDLTLDASSLISPQHAGNSKVDCDAEIELRVSLQSGDQTRLPISRFLAHPRSLQARDVELE